jgi:hypothetical protein
MKKEKAKILLIPDHLGISMFSFLFFFCWVGSDERKEEHSKRKDFDFPIKRIRGFESSQRLSVTMNNFFRKAKDARK